MKDLFVILWVLAVGPGFLALGIWSLRTHAWRDSVPLAEFVLDRAFGVDPPPRNAWDRRFAFAQAWFLTIFGALVLLGVAAILISDLVSE